MLGSVKDIGAQSDTMHSDVRECLVHDECALHCQLGHDQLRKLRGRHAQSSSGLVFEFLGSIGRISTAFVSSCATIHRAVAAM